MPEKTSHYFKWRAGISPFGVCVVRIEFRGREEIGRGVLLGDPKYANIFNEFDTLDGALVFLLNTLADRVRATVNTQERLIGQIDNVAELIRSNPIRTISE